MARAETIIGTGYFTISHECPDGTVRVCTLLEIDTPRGESYHELKCPCGDYEVIQGRF
jgi:hypothetical protein